MHNALSQRKRQMRYGGCYALCMKSPNERLKAARELRFSTAVEAADSLGVPRSTYIGHENGSRGFPAGRAPQYARKFKVTEEWLLYGKGSIDDAPDERIDIPSVEQLEAMVRLALMEVQPGARLADYPPIVASSLRDQLGLLQAGGGIQPDDEQPVGLAIILGTGARPRLATSEDAPEE